MKKLLMAVLILLGTYQATAFAALGDMLPNEVEAGPVSVFQDSGLFSNYVGGQVRYRVPFDNGDLFPGTFALEGELTGGGGDLQFGSTSLGDYTDLKLGGNLVYKAQAIKNFQPYLGIGTGFGKTKLNVDVDGFDPTANGYFFRKAFVGVDYLIHAPSEDKDFLVKAGTRVAETKSNLDIDLNTGGASPVIDDISNGTTEWNFYIMFGKDW